MIKSQILFNRNSLQLKVGGKMNSEKAYAIYNMVANLSDWELHYLLDMIAAESGRRGGQLTETAYVERDLSTF